MSKKFLVGFISGAVVGTVTGLLLASDKSSEIRNKVSAKINDCFSSVKRSLGLENNGNHSEEMSEWEQAERPYTTNKV